MDEFDAGPNGTNGLPEVSSTLKTTGPGADVPGCCVMISLGFFFHGPAVKNAALVDSEEFPEATCNDLEDDDTPGPKDAKAWDISVAVICSLCSFFRDEEVSATSDLKGLTYLGFGFGAQGTLAAAFPEVLAGGLAVNLEAGEPELDDFDAGGELLGIGALTGTGVVVRDGGPSCNNSFKPES